MKKSWILLLPTLLTFNSCKVMKNAENASINSEKAAYTTEPLSYLSTASGSSLCIESARNAMIESESFDEKAAQAAKIMKCLYGQVSFKVWNTKFLNYDSFYQAKIEEDVKYIRRLATEFMPHNGKYSITDTSGNNGNIKALAAALHQTNPWCKNSPHLRPIACKSMLEHIHDALASKYVYGVRESDMPVHHKVVHRLKGETAFLYMLELRVKFLPLIGIAHISYVEKSLFEKVKMLFFEWAPELEGGSNASRTARKAMTDIHGLRQEYINTKRKKLELTAEFKKVKESLTNTEFEDKEKELKKAEKKLEKIAKKTNKKHEQNKKRFGKSIAEDIKLQSTKLGPINPSEADLDYFAIVRNHVVAERDFLRSLTYVDGSGYYKVQKPIRFADLHPLVIKMLKKLNFRKLDRVSDEAYESVNIKRSDVDGFKDVVRDLLDNAEYKKIHPEVKGEALTVDESFSSESLEEKLERELEIKDFL